MRRTNPLALGLLASGIVLALLALAHPVAEIGFIDDWSYLKTAEVFARTGKIVYNGWATAMLGWEIPWTALFIRVFGDSFTAARLSTLPLDVGTLLLFHLCAARFGIRPRIALFGSLTLGLSPIFLPMSFTLMTDMGGLFFILLCLYLCLRALGARSAAGSIGWLAAAAVTNVLGGTSRQITWLGVLVLVPCTGWLLRRNRSVLVAAGALWIAGFAAILAAMHWFARQPYSIPEEPVPMTMHSLIRVAEQAVSTLLCLALVVLPVLLAWLLRVGRLPNRTRRTFLVLALAFGTLLLALNLHQHYKAPWLLDLFTIQGLGQLTNVLPGDRPDLFGFGGTFLIGLITVLSALAFLVSLRSTRLSEATASELDPAAGGSLAWHSTLWLLVPFCLAYLLLLTPRAAVYIVVDRYLLGLMPFVLILLLRLYQETVSDRLPALSYVALALFALFGVVGIHDWFSLLRANQAALAELLNAGLPREQVYAGVAADGLYQIEKAGYVNDWRLRVPAGSYHPVAHNPALGGDCSLGFETSTPVVKGPYVITSSPLSCFVPSSYSPVPYTIWKPPFERNVYVEKIAEAGAPR